MKKPYIIAEIGVNFYDTAKKEEIPALTAAKKYIKFAKESGADAVKFQSYKAGSIVSKNSPAYWDLSKEPTTSQYELFKKHDKFNYEDYLELYKYSKELNIDFMSTPFDFESVDFLEEMVDVYKISSSDLSNIPFLKYIASKGKPIILSVGASYLSEIDEAVREIQESGCEDLTLLHCVLSYPTSYEDANLNQIKSLKRIFPTLKIGYSDHTLPDKTMTVLTTAYLYGAEVIEKHFTLDKKLPGNDHYHAGDPDDFRIAVENIELIQKISGIDDVTISSAELIPRREARRSMVVNRDILKGMTIHREDIEFKRPGTGIAPNNLDIVVNSKAQKDIEEDSILTWDMIIEKE